MTVDLKGKTALVTGSTSGIGLGIAKVLAARGANILINGFGDTDKPRQEIEQAGAPHGIRTAYDGADLSKVDEIEALAAFALKEFGRIDILVNNAGIQHTAPVEAFPIEKWDAIIALNLSSVFHTTRLLLPAMKQADWGRIINIASVHGLVGSAEKSAYVAAKHGVVGFTKVVALETATTGVTVNAICPGWVLTPLVQKQIDDLAKKEGISGEAASDQLLGAKEPSKAFTTPAELGELAAFLCADAAHNVRGVAWNMDGGWVAQ